MTAKELIAGLQKLPPDDHVHLDVLVESLRSSYDGKTLAYALNGYRIGPDLGPWTVLGSEVVSIPVERVK